MDNTRENRTFRRWMLNRMPASKRAAFRVRERYMYSLQRIKKEAEDWWREVVCANTPQWQRDLALSIPPKFYCTLVNALSVALIAAEWKRAAFLFNKTFQRPFEALSRFIYAFGINTRNHMGDTFIEMRVSKGNRVLAYKKWDIDGAEEYLTLNKKTEEE